MTDEAARVAIRERVAEFMKDFEEHAIPEDSPLYWQRVVDSLLAALGPEVVLVSADRRIPRMYPPHEDEHDSFIEEAVLSDVARTGLRRTVPLVVVKHD